jgi:hypothetical protein
MEEVIQRREGASIVFPKSEIARPGSGCMGSEERMEGEPGGESEGL